MTCGSDCHPSFVVVVCFHSPGVVLSFLFSYIINMSDALCGPSNPLQQFKQQTQYDRTLQQDRLTSRHTPAQGFRSIDPNAGLLDPEFEAFQAGLPPSELSNLPTVHPQSQSLAGPSQPPSWATDFQRMQISPPPSFQPQQQYTPQPTQAPNNWAQGFRQHVAQTTPRTQHAAPTPQAFQHMARYGGMNGYQSNFAQSSYAQQPVQSKGKQAVTEQFDDAAFEQAFDLARDALMAETQPLQDAGMAEEMAYVNGASTGNMDQEGMQNPAADLAAIAARVRARRFEAEKAAPAADWKMQEELVRQPDRHLPPLSEINIPRQDEQMQDDTKPANDDDALAQTAQELLEKVEHNQTDKFRNSQFLGLMRRLRDREVKVEGDKMVETVRSPLKHPLPATAAPDSAYGSGAATPEPDAAIRRAAHVPPRTPPPEFDTHVEYGWSEEHQFDHWESPLPIGRR